MKKFINPTLAINEVLNGSVIVTSLPMSAGGQNDGDLAPGREGGAAGAAGSAPIPQQTSAIDPERMSN